MNTSNAFCDLLVITNYRCGLPGHRTLIQFLGPFEGHCLSIEMDFKQDVSAANCDPSGVF
jgi:hypothetical protein